MKRPRTSRGRRGNALIEFALSFFLIFAVFSGIFQFGYSFYVYNTVLASVANAAELGSKMTYDTASPTTYSDALKNMVVYGSTTAGTTSIVRGLATSNVTVTVNLAGTIPSDITITINNYTIDAVFTTFTFNGKPRATTVFMGQVSCSTC